MKITQELIDAIRYRYDNYGIDTILPQNIKKDLMIQYIKTYEKFNQGNANLLEITFLTLFALWFAKNDEIEVENIDLYIFYTYRYYYQCLQFSSKI